MRAHEIFSNQHSSTAPYGTLLFVRGWDSHSTISEGSCHEWFQKFKNGEFDIEDKERSGRPKVYEDAESEALMDQDS